MRPKLAFAMAADKTRHVFDADALARLARSCDIVRAEPLEELSSPEARAVLAPMAAEAVAPMSSEEFAARQQRARDRFGALVREANIRLN